MKIKSFYFLNKNMTKFQIASDLHIEAYDKNPVCEDFIDPNCDILILAGDIGRITRFDQIKSFLFSVCPRFKIVLYVPGNQEYYRVENMEEYSFDEINLKLTELQKEIKNLYVLNQKMVIINDVCIVGCTLWSEAMITLPEFIVKIPSMSTRRYNKLHFEAVKFLKKAISYSKFKKLKLLVVTHHCPSYSFLQFQSRFSSLYASNLDYLFFENIHTWIFGHTHENHDKFINKIRFVTNQKGKGKNMANNFLKNKIIEV